MKQTRILGTYDEPNPLVQAAAEQYINLLALRKKTKLKEDQALEKLITVMREQDIAECEADGFICRLQHEEEDKIKLVKLELRGDEEIE